MKKILIFLMVIATLVGVYSCNKDEDRVVLDTSKIVAPVLDNSNDGDSLEITSDNIDSSMVLTWQAAGYGFNTAITYFVQMDLIGNNFNNANTLGTTSGATSYAVPYSDLNNKLLLLEADPETPIALNVEFRVISLISTGVDTVTSNVVTIPIKPYYIVISYPQLYVPGAYQGWNPAAADSIGSKANDGTFEGYIYMSEAGEFKFTSDRDWAHTNYGFGGADGVLDTDPGASNLSVPEEGFYKFNVNTNDLTWTYLNTTWGVIGDATSGGEDTDTPMEYNPDTQLWTASTDLSAGDIKFRANGTSDLNYGVGDIPGRLIQDGNNIHVDEAGSYTITLDLSTTIYKYKLEKE